MVRDGGDFIEQGRKNRFSWWWLRGLKNTQHSFSNIRHNPFDFAPPAGTSQGKRLQSSNKISQKACEVVIPFIQRQPGDRLPATGDPFADQRGFTKTGGGGDEGQLAARREAIVQLLDQTRAEDNFSPRWGDVKFRSQNRRGHKSIIKPTLQNSIN